MKVAILAVCVGLVSLSSNASAQTTRPSGSSAIPMISLKMPAPPDPVAVTLDSTKTAILVADMVGPICGSQPNCTGKVVPKISGLLSRARQAKVYILYTLARPGTTILPAVAPASGEPTFVAHGQNRFFKTDLGAMLKAKGITTLILVGWKIDGSLLYTSVAATLEGYTVVVPEDATSAPAEYEVAIGRFMILNQSSGNAANAPLKPKASTLSQSAMITFK